MKPAITLKFPAQGEDERIGDGRAKVRDVRYEIRNGSPGRKIACNLASIVT